MSVQLRTTGIGKNLIGGGRVFAVQLGVSTPLTVTHPGLYTVFPNLHAIAARDITGPLLPGLPAEILHYSHKISYNGATITECHG